MSRTYRHMPDWAIESYQDYLGEDSHRKAMEAIGLWRINYHHKEWNRRVHLRPGRRPQLHDGNFSRTAYQRYAHRNARREQRRRDYQEFIRDGEYSMLTSRHPFCRVCNCIH